MSLGAVSWIGYPLSLVLIWQLVLLLALYIAQARSFVVPAPPSNVGAIYNPLLTDRRSDHHAASSFRLSSPYRRRTLPSPPIMEQQATSSDDTENVDWSPLDPESLVSAPCLIEQELCEPSGDADKPRIAKDFAYANAVLDAWKQDEQEATTLWDTKIRPIVYMDEEETPLYGRIVVKNKEMSPDKKRPGILLFHTGAGPHDIFLYWKAAALVNSLADDDNDDNVVVLIADILSDDTGWAWDDDRTKYTRSRDQVLHVEEASDSAGTLSWSRPLLAKRIKSAINTMMEEEDVDPSRIAAIGWCLGGHSILELARISVNDDDISIRAMVTFHGVFDGVPKMEPFDDSDGAGALPDLSRCELLICNGVEDPFVKAEDMENALRIFQKLRIPVSLLQLRDARHGFSNPAQDFNTNSKAFGYHQESANKSWRQGIALLRRRLFQ